MKLLACIQSLFQPVKQPTTKPRPASSQPQIASNKDKVKQARRQLQEKRTAREGSWEATQFFKPD